MICFSASLSRSQNFFPARTTTAGQSGEAHVFLTQDNNLTAKVPLRRSILQCNLQQKYRSTGKHNPQRDDGPEKGLYRLRPIDLPSSLKPLDRPCGRSQPSEA